MVMDYLERIDRYHTFILVKDGRPVAGHTFLIHRRDLVWQVAWHDPAFDRLGVGTRLMDMVFQWSSTQPFDSIDLGGGPKKARWAPVNGENYVFHVYPYSSFTARRGRRMSAIVRRRALRLMHTG